MIIYHVLVIIIYNTHSLLNHLIFILLIIKNLINDGYFSLRNLHFHHLGYLVSLTHTIAIIIINYPIRHNHLQIINICQLEESINFAYSFDNLVSIHLIHLLSNFIELDYLKLPILHPHYQSHFNHIYFFIIVKMPMNF